MRDARFEQASSAPPLFRDTRPGFGLMRGCSLRL
jgi:hypothetical protein